LTVICKTRCSFVCSDKAVEELIGLAHRFCVAYAETPNPKVKAEMDELSLRLADKLKRQRRGI